MHHQPQLGLSLVSGRGQPTPPTAKHRSPVTRFLCRLDVCWTIFFFIFLVCIAVTTASVTQTLNSRSLMETWHAIHSVRICSINERIDSSCSSVFVMSDAFQTLHLQQALDVTSAHTLSLL